MEFKVNDREMETGVHSYIYGNAVPGAPMRYFEEHFWYY